MKNSIWKLVRRSRKVRVAFATAAFALPLSATGEGLNVLILSGSNNHNWRATTPVLQEILEEGGLFEVSVTERPHELVAGDLEGYDVLLSNWNTFGMNGPTWPESLRAAVLDFVRAGKGFVVVHAGSSSFWEWDGFPELTGATWTQGLTSHRQPHEFKVEIVEPDHPVTRGMEAFTTKDELWINPDLHEEALVLTEAEGQPSALVTSFGDGRGFTLLLGHEHHFMKNEGFQTLLLRGTKWAATGTETFDP